MAAKNNILLTVVIPTYNRAELLRHTLSMMQDQLKRNSALVKLVVCDNVCTDHTAEVVQDMKTKGMEIEYIQYKEHVPVGMSIMRSIENAKSKYFLLWSDDDFPAPMMIDIIVDTLQKYPEISTLSFNRINAFSSSEAPTSLFDLTVFNPNFENYTHYYESSQEYAEDHFTEVDFMSINVVALKAWEKGMEIYSDKHLGFQFIAPILYGAQGSPCIYIEYPMCFKRNPAVSEISYANKWPLYAYVGIPRILKDLQNRDVIRDAREVFAKYKYNNRNNYINCIFYFCYSSPQIYAPYINEMISYQQERLRIIITKAIIWPKFIQNMLKWVYKMVYIFDKIAQKLRK